MTISKRLERKLHCTVDFSEFYLLEVIVKKHKPAAVLLAPKKPEKENTYFGLKLGDSGQWFDSLTHLLEACVNMGYISKLHAWRLLRRYRAKQTRSKICTY